MAQNSGCMCSFLEEFTAFSKGVYVPEKLTTISGGGRGVGRNTRQWLREITTESSLQGGGSQALWSLEGTTPEQLVPVSKEME